ncbi:hypothetical protein [Oribacterium sp. WCC10]|nr:hypothetical protein [Oribacterium sp. WCC10]
MASGKARWDFRIESCRQVFRGVEKIREAAFDSEKRSLSDWAVE